MNQPNRRQPINPSIKRRQIVGAPTTRRRERTVRLNDEVAARVAEGHPWVFSDALRGRQIQAAPGDAFDLVDTSGHFIGRALYDSSGPIVLRVFSTRPDTAFDIDWLRSATHRASIWRRQVFRSEPTSAMRVLNGDSEGVPATNVDRYGDYLVITAYSVVIEPHLTALIAALAEVWQPKGVYLQRRYMPATPDRPRAGAELVSGEAAPPEVLVSEGHARFSVDVTSPVSTGLFIDMRAGRAVVGARAAGRRVLNCFSYTGSFTVIAALHGAAEVVSVDAAERAHARARHNCELNGLDGNRTILEFITGDTLATLERMRIKQRFFDLLILDPPTFASTKQRSFTALKDYADLVTAAVTVAAPGALLLAACNATKLSWSDFQRAIGRGAREASHSALMLERLLQPADYPTLASFEEGRYLKGGLFVVHPESIGS